MRVLFTSTWGFGHTFPMVPLARALVAGGHGVRWVTHPQTCGIVRAAGLDAVPAGLDADGVRELEGAIRAVTSSMPPPSRAAYNFPHLFGAGATPAMLPGLLAAAQEWRPDLHVHEQAELASPLVAAALGVPSLTHSFGGAVPPAFVAAAGEQVTPLWEAHGLRAPPYAGCFEDGYVDICPPSVQPVPLDHLSRRWLLRPDGYTGEASGPLPAIVTAADERPLVYLTLGTVVTPMPVFVAALEGLGRLPVRLLVAIGPNGDPAALGAQPGHVQVVRWVQQSEVVGRAALVVSHAGSGTFLGCLAAGVPQLCLPQGADQFRNAGAAVSAGVGLALGPDEITADAVEDAAGRLLAEGSFGQAAEMTQAEVAAMPGADEVAAELVRALAQT